MTIENAFDPKEMQGGPLDGAFHYPKERIVLNVAIFS